MVDMAFTCSMPVTYTDNHAAKQSRHSRVAIMCKRHSEQARDAAPVQCLIVAQEMVIWNSKALVLETGQLNVVCRCKTKRRTSWERHCSFASEHANTLEHASWNSPKAQS